jgi:hypothetical protein
MGFLSPQLQSGIQPEQPTNVVVDTSIGQGLTGLSRVLGAWGNANRPEAPAEPDKDEIKSGILRPYAAELARLADLRDQGKGGNYNANVAAVIRQGVSEHPEYRTDFEGLLGITGGSTPSEVQPFSYQMDQAQIAAAVEWGQTPEGQSAYIRSYTRNPDGTTDHDTTNAKLMVEHSRSVMDQAALVVLERERNTGVVGSEVMIQRWNNDAYARAQSEVDGIISSYDPDNPEDTAVILRNINMRRATVQAAFEKELTQFGVTDPKQRAEAIKQALAPYDNFSTLVATNDKTLADSMSALGAKGRMDLGRTLSSVLGNYAYDIVQAEYFKEQVIVAKQDEIQNVIKLWSDQAAAGLPPVNEATDSSGTLDDEGNPVYGGFTDAYLQPFADDPSLAAETLQVNIPMLEKPWKLDNPNQLDTFANLEIQTMAAAFAQIGALGTAETTRLLSQRVKEFRTILNKGGDTADRLELHTTDFIVEQIGRNTAEVENQFKNLPKGFYLKNVNGKYSLELDVETFNRMDDPITRDVREALSIAGLPPTTQNILGLMTSDYIEGVTGVNPRIEVTLNSTTEAIPSVIAGIERMNSISVFAKSIPQLTDNFAQGVERFVPDERKRLVDEANESMKVKEDVASFGTPEEAQAAQDQGLIVPGQIIYINGKRFQVTP